MSVKFTDLTAEQIRWCVETGAEFRASRGQPAPHQPGWSRGIDRAALAHADWLESRERMWQHGSGHSYNNGEVEPPPYDPEGPCDRACGGRWIWVSPAEEGE